MQSGLARVYKMSVKITTLPLPKKPDLTSNGTKEDNKKDEKKLLI